MKSKCGSKIKTYFLSWNLRKVQKPNNSSEEAEAGQHLQRPVWIGQAEAELSKGRKEKAEHCSWQSREGMYMGL